MAPEENVFGNNGGGGSGSGCSGGGDGGGGSNSNRSKKSKPKKVPQRGLGVAQLEKIRLEEQQRKDIEAANALAKTEISDSSAQFLTVLNPKFGGNLAPFQNSVHNPSNGLCRNHVPLGPNLEIKESWPGFLNADHDKQRLDHHHHHGFTFESPVNLPHRSHNFQWHSSSSSSSSSMVNSSSYSGISPSSVLSTQMEPPSNQSFRGNYFTPPPVLEEDKMVGMKRPYPFYLELPPAPRSSNSNYLYKPDELAASSNGSVSYMEPRNKCIREGPSNASPPPERIPSGVTKDDGDFLTLAPPSSSMNSKLKHPMDFWGQQMHKLSDQEYARRQIHEPGPSRSREQPINFFPIRVQTDQTSTGESNGNGDDGDDDDDDDDDDKEETIDLDLKL